MIFCRYLIFGFFLMTGQSVAQGILDVENEYLLEELKLLVVKVSASKDGASYGFGVLLDEQGKGYRALVTAEHVVGQIQNSGASSIWINFHDRVNCANEPTFEAKYNDCDRAAPVEVQIENWILNKELDLAIAKIPVPVGMREIHSLGTGDVLRRGQKVAFIGREDQWFVPASYGLISGDSRETGLVRIENVDVFPGTSGAPVLREDGTFIGIVLRDFSNSAEVLSVSKIVFELFKAGYKISNELADQFLSEQAEQLAEIDFAQRCREYKRNGGDWCGEFKVLGSSVGRALGDSNRDVTVVSSIQGGMYVSGQDLLIFEGESELSLRSIPALRAEYIGGKCWKKLRQWELIDQWTIRSDGTSREAPPEVWVWGSFPIGACADDSGKFSIQYQVCPNGNRLAVLKVDYDVDYEVDEVSDFVEFQLEGIHAFLYESFIRFAEFDPITVATTLRGTKTESGIEFAGDVLGVQVSDKTDDFDGNWGRVQVGDFLVGVNGKTLADSAALQCSFDSDDVEPEYDLVFYRRSTSSGGFFTVRWSQ